MKFDQGDTTFLRALMRRFGWKRRARANAACCWFQTFSEVRKAEDWSEFAWFSGNQALAPAGEHRSAQPAFHRSVGSQVQRARHRCGSSQVVEGPSRLANTGRALPSAFLHRRMQPWLDARKSITDCATKSAQAMRKACPPDFAPLSAVASEAAGCRTRHSLALCSRAGVLLFAVPG